MFLTRRAFGFGLLGSGLLLAAGVPALALLDEERVLLAATEALFPPVPGLPSPHEVDVLGAVRTYLGHMPPDVALQARGLLRAIEVGTLPTHRRRFSSLPASERTAVLQAMATSDLYPRRLMAHALKQLCAMGYWQHEATWAHLGYDGPLVGR